MQLKINHASFGYDGTDILEDVCFEINTNDKIAIIGKNGSGKTTLLKIISGEIELHQPDNTQPVFSVTGAPIIGSLNQMTFENENTTLWDELLKSYSNIIKLEQKIETLNKKLESEYTDKLVENFSRTLSEFELAGGYTYKAEINSIIASFGFAESDKTKLLSEFSGGQKTKIAFIKLILSKPDILLLDEPTNHLDIKAVRWLENYLASYKKAVVVVSHDRAFLDNTINTVFELEHKKLTKYVGNYTKYIETKKTNYEQALKKYETQQKEIAEIQAFIDRFRYKATKASAVQSRIKMLEKMEIFPKPQKPDTASFHTKISPHTESGSEVLCCTNLKIGYSQDNVLADISFKLQKKDRLAVIGGNGLGKSTLLRTLTSKLEPLSGDFKFGYHVEWAYFEQLASKLTSKKTVLEDFLDTFEGLSTTDARNSLGAFLFSGADVNKTLSSLSGGECVRLELCKIFERKPNLLILDEPTNHMDIFSKETLESLLLGYEGTIIFVSHDRYFVNKVATKLLIFEESGTRLFDGTLSELNNPFKITEDKKQDSSKKPEKIEYPIDYDEPQKEDKYQGMSFYELSKERSKTLSRLEKIEKSSKVAEEELKALNNDYVSPIHEGDFVTLMQIQADIENLENKISKFSDEWLELSENFEAITDQIEKLTQNNNN